MACWLVTVTSVLRIVSDRAGCQASPGGGRMRLGEYHFWKNRFVLGVERSRGLLSAFTCSSDCGQTRMWKNNQKTAVTNVHVFMLLTPGFQWCYRRGLSQFLSGFVGHRRGRYRGSRRRFPMNRCISVEISCFSGVRSPGCQRPGNRGRISTGRAGGTPAKIFSAACFGGKGTQVAVGHRLYLFRSNNTTAKRRRMSAAAPNGVSSATASWARRRSSSLAFSMPTTAG